MKKTTLFGLLIAGAILTTAQVSAQNATRGSAATTTTTREEVKTEKNKTEHSSNKECKHCSEGKCNKHSGEHPGKHKGETKGKSSGNHKGKYKSNEAKDKHQENDKTITREKK